MSELVACSNCKDYIAEVGKKLCKKCINKGVTEIVMEPEKYVYVARKTCGCVTGLVSYTNDKDNGKAVGEFISSGLTVDRVTLQHYRDFVRYEPGFFDCIHVAKQLSFEDSTNG